MKKIKNVVCATALAVSVVQAHADNWGCEVLLCMSNPAGPTAVAQCVPPISRLWRALADGDGWPFCDMGSGGGNQAAHNDWASPTNCPPQYINYYERDGGSDPYCSYTGAITIEQAGQPYMRVWWTPGGLTVTENLSPDAPVTEASERFMNDYAAWQAEQERLARIAAEEAQRGGN